MFSSYTVKCSQVTQPACLPVTQRTYSPVEWPTFSPVIPPACSPVPHPRLSPVFRPTFTGELANMFANALAKSDLYVTYMFTIDLANMFTSNSASIVEFMIWPTSSLVKLTGKPVDLVPAIQHLIQILFFLTYIHI